MPWLGGPMQWISKNLKDVANYAIAIFALLLVPIAVAIPNATLLWRIVLGGTGVIVLLCCVFFLYRQVHSRAYYTIVLTWDKHYKDAVLVSSKQFFSKQHITRAGRKELVEVNQIGDHSKQEWQELVNAALRQLNESKEEYRELHFVCHAYWMWCFALGAQIQDRYPLVLYHFQDGTYYRIWKISREIKNRKAVETHKYRYQICRPPELLRNGEQNDAICLAFACGSHDPSPAVQKYTQQHLPDVPLWVIRLEGGLDPRFSDRWVKAATDLANTVDHLSGSGSKELYVFGTMPDTLALMTGSAVGPYRRMHMMQYHQGSYFEVLEISPLP